LSGNRSTKRNVVWNTAGIAVEAATGFLVAPFLISRLGESTYGLWIVLGSLTGYFGLLSLGVRGAVGRHVAFHAARGDRARLDATVSCAVAMLGAVGGVAAGLLAATGPLLLRLFEVPPDQAESARLALLLVAANLGASLVANAFDATLWGYQRFDRLNAIDIPVTMLRAGATFLVIGTGGGLVALGVITLAATAAGGGAKAVAAFAHDRGLRVRPGAVTRGAVREIVGYGGWNLALVAAQISRTHLSPVLIGSALGLRFVTPFAVANRLLGFLGAFLSAVTGVLTPLATAAHAQNRADQLARLLLTGGQRSAVLAAGCVVLLVVLGAPLIVLWVGPHLAHAAPVLAVLALGELLPGTQYVACGVIQAKARHRLLAFGGMAETALVAGLSFLLIDEFGLTGAAVAIAVPGALCRGLVPMVVVCRSTGVPLGRYVRHVLLTPLLCTAVPGAGLAMLVGLAPPAGWFSLGGYAVAYLAAVAATYLVVVRPAGTLTRLRGLIRPRGESVGGPAPRKGVVPESATATAST
jgi:O-antigen/teichoic acid export membrane protein